MGKKSSTDEASTEPRRNLVVEAAVQKILVELDGLIGNDFVRDPAPKAIKELFDAAIKKAKGSARLAIVFFIAYSTTSKNWDYDSIPVGIRGTHGDKKLAASLTTRHITFHFAVTAFGENLGWKGNVRKAKLSSDDRFSKFIDALKLLNAGQRQQLFEHAISKLFESRMVPKALPKLPAKYLTYSRSVALCEELLALQTEGHVQQFLVAAFLDVHRSRSGNTIKTHHPHASDTFDNTCGDVEEFRNGALIAAYEITVRADWKNRLPDFHSKMVKGGLSKYVIIASGVHADSELSSAQKLLDFTKSILFDLAIVDIKDFFCVFCAELSCDELTRAFNNTYEYLLRTDLCGRREIQEQFSAVVSRWIDAESNSVGN